MSARSETYDLKHRISERTNVDLSFDDANTLRRAEKTLRRWAELECGDSNDFSSWAIEREEPWAIERAAWNAIDLVRWWDGKQWARKKNRRTYPEKSAENFPLDGAWRETGSHPHFVRYAHDGQVTRTRIPDREAGALRRVANVCKRNGLHFFHQTDPRGCALYVSNEPLTATNYTHGVACCA